MEEMINKGCRRKRSLVHYSDDEFEITSGEELPI